MTDKQFQAFTKDYEVRSQKLAEDYQRQVTQLQLDYAAGKISTDEYGRVIAGASAAFQLALGPLTKEWEQKYAAYRGSSEKREREEKAREQRQKEAALRREKEEKRREKEEKRRKEEEKRRKQEQKTIEEQAARRLRESLDKQEMERAMAIYHKQLREQEQSIDEKKKKAPKVSKVLLAILIIFSLFFGMLDFIFDITDAAWVWAIVLLGSTLILGNITTKANSRKAHKEAEIVVTVIPSAAPAINRGEQLISNLRNLQREVEKPELKKNIGEIIKLVEIVVNKDKTDGTDHEPFFVRYDDVLCKLLTRYDQIENTRIDTPEMRETMARIEDGVADIAVACKREVADLFKSDLLDINAETAAFLDDLKRKGLLDKQ